MKLADQIALLRETLDELGVSPADGDSTGECAAKYLKQAIVKVHELDGYVTALEESREAYIQRAAELDDMLERHGLEENYGSCDLDALEQYIEDLTRTGKEWFEAQKTEHDLRVTAEARVAELEQNAPSTDGLCDSCSYLKDAAVPRVCMNPEAWRQGFSRRGYSQKTGHGCECWSGA